MLCKIQKPTQHPAKKFLSKTHILCRFTNNSPENPQKPRAQRKPHHQDIRQNLRTSRITKKLVDWFWTQIIWHVSIKDELLSKGILKQTEFPFAVSEQALTENRSINKWHVTCSMYSLFDRCNLGKVFMDSFLDTKI